MIFTALFFYLFAGVCIASAFMVIAAKNPVHSVLFLILAFVNAAGLFMLLGAEFLAMILVVVYVGAVAGAVPVRGDDARRRFRRAAAGLPAVSADRRLSSALSCSPNWSLVVGAWVIGPDVQQAIATPIPPLDRMINTEALGRVLYTRYVYFFQAAGLVLLVAMIGAIVLTLRHKPNVKRQNIAEQVARSQGDRDRDRQGPAGPRALASQGERT